LQNHQNKKEKKVKNPQDHVFQDFWHAQMWWPGASISPTSDGCYSSIPRPTPKLSFIVAEELPGTILLNSWTW
jgi:hypothetical protein